MNYSQAAAAALSEAMEADPAVVALGEDLGRGGIFAQYRGLQQKFGADRVIDTPISEATIMGAAVGMALAGLRPVVEMRVVDFALCAMDELVNQAAKNRFMFGGQGRVPLVVRMPIGLWTASAAQHSQSLEAWFAHIPGLVVVAPSAPDDNYGLLASALASGDPVVYMEHKELWAVEGDVVSGTRVPLGVARRLREGGDVTIVSWSKAVPTCVAAATELATAGISGRRDRPAHAVAVGPRDGAGFRRANGASAGRARSRAGGRLRRGDRRRGGRSHRMPHPPAGRAAHSFRLFEAAGRRVAGHGGGGRRGGHGVAAAAVAELARTPRIGYTRRSTGFTSMTQPRTAIVTGAASGIGAATVTELAARGYRVAGIDCNGPGVRAVMARDRRAASRGRAGRRR